MCACACVVLCGAGVAVSAMSHRFTKGVGHLQNPSAPRLQMASASNVWLARRVGVFAQHVAAPVEGPD